MLRYRIGDLQDRNNGHLLQDMLPGDFICAGGLAFPKPGERSHTNDGPDGRDYHVHHDREAFVILQGKGFMEINGERHPVTTGDIIVVEPGEDHHLNASVDEPLVTLWCHAGPERHKNQR